jgi:hypothetical protein
MVASAYPSSAGCEARAEPVGPAPVGFRAMGVLDDAIREHLELKRQHGAPDEELRRQEVEALGPARRETEAAEEPELEPDAEEAAAEPAGASSVAIEEEPPARESGTAEPEPYVDETAPEEGSRYAEQSGLDAPEEPRLDDTPPRRFPAAEGDEVGQRDEGEEPPDEEADLLEDTPEFLQETPEHDRLWFEQKPPRDFDFD